MMASKALRRLAADHGALHHQELPPYFLFGSGDCADDLTQLEMLLAGPPATPFAAGVWKLHLSIPPQYPQQPPTAHFRTPIFHPNIDPSTGGVCVETLKRDWDSRLTLRDVLVTISCLLVYPNPDSALNAEAGALIQESFEAFARRAELMTSIHAAIPPSIRAVVHEAQTRGQEVAADGRGEQDRVAQEAPVRRRRTIAKVRGTMRLHALPIGAPRPRREPAGPSTHPSTRRPFVLQTGHDDVLGGTTTPNRPARLPMPREMDSQDEDDSEMADLDQENDPADSPRKPISTLDDSRTPRRPHGAPVPLGELILPEQDDFDSSIDHMEIDSEYPPSPRKSPCKRAAKPHAREVDSARPESSRRAARRREPATTPPNVVERPLAQDSPFGLLSVSPRKPPGRRLFHRAPRNSPPDIDSPPPPTRFLPPATPPPVAPSSSSASSQSKREQRRRDAALTSRLWEACGRDVRRWNRGDFDRDIFPKKAGRW